MTAIINNVVVQGKPEEIKELLDAYNPPETFTTVEFNSLETELIIGGSKTQDGRIVNTYELRGVQ